MNTEPVHLSVCLSDRLVIVAVILWQNGLNV